MNKVYYHCGFVIRDLQNEKRDHPHLPHSPLSEVEGVRIVVISFRNIAKNTFILYAFFREDDIHNLVMTKNLRLDL